MLAALVIVLQFLDALSESGNILAHAGNGQAEVWRYVSLRTPQIIARFLPYSVLLGAIITYSTLNQNSEVIALKASGLSAHQVLAPMIVASDGRRGRQLRVQRPHRQPRDRDARCVEEGRICASSRSTAATAPTCGREAATI